MKEMETKNFKINTERKRMAQKFDAENIEITKAGKVINVYQAIQDAREDTEIYPTLERYGCIERLKLNTPEVYEDIRNIKDLRSSMEQVQEANKLWESLPLEVRKEFGHSSKEFLEKGENWLKNKIDLAKAKNEELQKPTPETPKIEKVENNG